MSLKEKVVLITGASRGIGKEAAIVLANAGARIVIHFNENKVAAKEVLKQIGEKDHLIVQGDLSIPVQVERICASVISKYGKLDILVNNAGVYEEFDILNLSYDQWQDSWNKTININLTGAANLSFLVAKEMKDKGGCRIINISSRGAFRGEPWAPAYGASKAGMNAFGQSFGKAFAKHNIFVFTIAPGFVETDMSKHVLKGERGKETIKQSPLERVAQPEELANLILYLASEAPEYMTGCIIDMNGASYLRT